MVEVRQGLSYFPGQDPERVRQVATKSGRGSVSKLESGRSSKGSGIWAGLQHSPAMWDIERRFSRMLHRARRVREGELYL